LKGLVLVASGSRLRVAPELLEAAPSEFEQTVDRIISFAWSKNSPSEVIELGRKLMLQGDPTTLRGDFLACNQFDLMQALEAIRLPTLIICGTEDRLTPPKFSQFMADGISQSRLEMVAGAGHMVMLEKPDEVTESITDFVLQCGSRAVS
jgi:pimeloyl-ACP methyl ester carboxylesterase